MKQRKPESWMARNWGVLLLTAALGIKACNSPYIHPFESEAEERERYEKEIHERLHCRTFQEKFGAGQYRIHVEGSDTRTVVIDCR